MYLLRQINGALRQNRAIFNMLSILHKQMYFVSSQNYTFSVSLFREYIIPNPSVLEAK